MKRTIAIVLFLKIAITVFSQDPQFTQFYASPLYLAPSFAGSTEGQRFVANYRNQWSFIPGSYQTYSISFDQNISTYRSGIGLILLGDYAGDGNMGATTAGLVYSYDITPIEGLNIRPGLGFYYVQQSIDYSKLVFGHQLYLNNPYIPPSLSPSTRDIDVSTSILAYTNNIWLGATWDHLLKPERTFWGDDAVIPYKISVYGGVKFKRDQDFNQPKERSISLAFNFKTQDRYTHLDLGFYCYWQPLIFGFWYRGMPLPFQTDAFSLLFGYKHEQISFAYSYDFTLSRLGIGSGGSHELALLFEMNLKPRKRYRAIPCPTF
jgi:type IX secretion system PorP/SprF family membrane protein